MAETPRAGNVQRKSNSTESALNRTPQHETELKLRILDLALPAESAVVFGDVWRVEGAYARRCSESYGCIAERRAPNPPALEPAAAGARPLRPGPVTKIRPLA